MTQVQDSTNRTVTNALGFAFAFGITAVIVYQAVRPHNEFGNDDSSSVILVGLLWAAIGAFVVYMRAQRATPTRAATTHRKCPHCKQQMRCDASVCPHCRSASEPWQRKDNHWWRVVDGDWYLLDEPTQQWKRWETTPTSKGIALEVHGTPGSSLATCEIAEATDQ